MANETVVQSQPTTAKPDAGTRSGERDSRQGPSLAPAVDIVERDDGIVLTADMPGVAPDGLEVEVDHQVLSIIGTIDVDMPAGLKAVHGELRGTRYERRFTLSNELDPEGVEASLDGGVLTVRLPKKAMHKPRRIEIRSR